MADSLKTRVTREVDKLLEDVLGATERLSEVSLVISGDPVFFSSSSSSSSLCVVCSSSGVTVECGAAGAAPVVFIQRYILISDKFGGQHGHRREI